MRAPSTIEVIIYYNSTIMIYPSREGTTYGSGSIFWEVLLHVCMRFGSIGVGYLSSALCVCGRFSLETRRFSAFVVVRFSKAGQWDHMVPNHIYCNYCCRRKLPLCLLLLNPLENPRTFTKNGSPRCLLVLTFLHGKWFLFLVDKK